jgi:hypothetical protein
LLLDFLLGFFSFQVALTTAAARIFCYRRCVRAEVCILESSSRHYNMDLRLPPLPDLLQPNLLAGIAPSYSSVARADAGGDAKELLSQGAVPPYLEKLLQLQKLQDDASVSFQHPSQQPAHTATLSALAHGATHPQQSCEISGAELAPMLTQHWHSPPDQRQAFAFGSSVSNSFVEVDEE